MAQQLQWSEVSDLVREVGHERWIASRLAEWRQEANNMTQAELAQRMTDLGYEMNKTSVWKIENPHKKAGRRSISIGEAIGFARAFGKSLDELLLPPAALANLTGWQGYTQALDLIQAATLNWSRYKSVVETTRERVAASTKLRAQLESELELVIEARLKWISELSSSALSQYGFSSFDEMARSDYFDDWAHKTLRDILGSGPIEPFTQKSATKASDG